MWSGKINVQFLGSCEEQARNKLKVQSTEMEEVTRKMS